MVRQRTGGLITVLVTLLTLAITWAARVWVRANLPFGEPVSVIGNAFRLTHSENSGVAFSILRGSGLVPWLSAAALVAVVAYLWRPLQQWRLGQIALGLILGGGLANLLDRFDDGRVTDYIDWGIATWRFATFNLPDTAIVTGLVLVSWLLTRHPTTQAEPPHAHFDPQPEHEAAPGHYD